MKVIVAGCRYFKDYALMKAKLDKIFSEVTEGIEIVSGGQVTTHSLTGEKFGADYLGERYAQENGHPIKLFPADWAKYKLKAGPIRNAEMAEYATHLVAFWEGRSRGTKNMIDTAKRKGLVVRVIHY